VSVKSSAPSLHETRGGSRWHREIAPNRTPGGWPGAEPSVNAFRKQTDCAIRWSRVSKRGPGKRLAVLLTGALVALLLGGVACGHKDEAQLANDDVARGLAAQRAGDLAGAATAYLSALEHDPHNKFALFDLGTIDQSEGRTASARNYYQRALQIDPDFESALFNLAIVESSLKNLPEAEDLYRHVIEVDPNSAAAHLNLGFLLKQEGKIKAAERELTIAYQLDPSLASPGPGGTPSATPSSHGP
jgi:tetratricopeptide (TPR) repeat protein